MKKFIVISISLIVLGLIGYFIYINWKSIAPMWEIIKFFLIVMGVVIFFTAPR
jgi:hypothetical protein